MPRSGLKSRTPIAALLSAGNPARSHNNYGKTTEKETFEEFRSRKLLFNNSFRDSYQLIPKSTRRVNFAKLEDKNQ